MRISNNKYGLILSVPGFIIIVALVIFPLATLFTASFLRYTAIYPIKFTGFRNFRYIFGDRLFWLSLQKTVIYAGGGNWFDILWWVDYCAAFIQDHQRFGYLQISDHVFLGGTSRYFGFHMEMDIQPQCRCFQRSSHEAEACVRTAPYFFQPAPCHACLHNCRFLGSHSLHDHFCARWYREHPPGAL